MAAWTLGIMSAGHGGASGAPLRRSPGESRPVERRVRPRARRTGDRAAQPTGWRHRRSPTTRRRRTAICPFSRRPARASPSPQARPLDELAVEVYWHAPNLSKQRSHRTAGYAAACRSTSATTRIATASSRTTFLTRFVWVKARTSAVCRIPLGPHGPDDYDYLIADSLRITIAGRRRRGVRHPRPAARPAGAPRGGQRLPGAREWGAWFGWP